MSRNFAGLRRWFVVCAVLFLGLSALMWIMMLLVGPGLVWLLHDVPYALPSWPQIRKWQSVALVIAFSCGTIIWYSDRRGWS